MRIIKITGLLVFITGFIIFNVSFFWANYTLTTEIVKQKLTDEEKQHLFLSASSGMTDYETHSVFRFVSSLSDVFNQINQQQLDTYSINEEDIQLILKHKHDPFELSVVDVVFPSESKADVFKKKIFRDYGGWLEGQSATEDQIRTVAGNINKYGVINQVGFDRYAVNDLKYALTKASAQSPVASHPLLFIFLTIGLCIIGGMIYLLPKVKGAPGIKNNNVFFNSMKNTGWLGILTGSWLIAFYILLYFYPEYMTNWIIMVDPISKVLNGHEASRFFLYGFLYT